MHILICLHFSCIVHIEPVAQDCIAEEAEASEVEVQEELQEPEAAEQVEEQEFDLTNPDQQPGKQIGRASCRKECRSRWSPYH